MNEIREVNFMTKYIINRCKKYTWLMLLITLVWTLSTMCSQYIYKFIGFVIDYGLNYSGKPYDGEFLFLFNGTFGGYGTLTLVITLAGCVVLFALVSYIMGYLSSYLQMRGQHLIANGYRVEIYNKSKRKKMPFKSGDFIILLQEDIYQPGNIFISYYSGMLNNLFSTILTLMMLSNISPYLLITPLALTPLLIYFTIRYNKQIYNENRVYRSIDGELKNSINNATATKEINNFDIFKSVNVRHTKERIQLSHVKSNNNVILNLIKLAIYIISCTVAGVLAIKGKILIGEYLIFTAFINTIYSQILSFINYIITIKSTYPRIEKVRELMEEHLNEASKKATN